MIGTKTPTFYWYVPIEGDSRFPGMYHPEHEATDLEHLKSVIQIAEWVGFDGALIPFNFRNNLYGANAPYVETWTTTAILAGLTSRIRLLPALLTGIYHPWVTARALATLDHFTGGRLDLNVISGSGVQAEAAVGDTLAHDERYDRTAEFIDCLRGLW